MQKMAGSYLVKRLGEELFAKPARPDVVEGEEPDDGLDGRVIQNEEGRDVGTARRLPAAAVYVVTDGFEPPDRTLARCLGDPASRVLFQEDGGRITAVIYVPDPTTVPPRPEGLRADEV